MNKNYDHSIDNPEQFNYLKVAEYDQGRDLDDNYQSVYPLTCVNRSSVHIQYSDNSTYSISFDVFNDGSAGFKALHELSHIIAGGQIFVIQKYTKKVNGVATASVSATQLVNADFQRTKQPRMYKYVSKSDDDDGSGTDKNTVYINLGQLLKWYQSKIDMMGFRFITHGHFPQRPMKNVGKWTGKDLLTHIVQTWPGTVIIGWGRDIHIYGYQKQRDAQGNLQSVRDIDTGLRFDALADTKDIQISRDTSKMCNAIEVKSATHSIIPPEIKKAMDKRKEQAQEHGDDSNAGVQADEDLASEFVYQTVPYFPNFLATSARSIHKYGLYAASEVLDQGFIHKKAAMAAARERMVLDPVISITATVDHPGKTESQPIPGHKYLIGIEQEDEAHHVVLRGFDWYPFDPAKGAQLTLNSVDPGIIDNLRSTIIHDVELSPSVTKFNELTDDDDDSDDSSSSESGSESGGGEDPGEDPGDPGETGEEQENTDDDTSRPDETGPGNSGGGQGGNTPTGPSKPGAKAYLPIGDRNARAYITSHGNPIVNIDNDKYIWRVADTHNLTNIQQGKGYPDSERNNHWQHLAMFDIKKDNWITDEGATKFWRGVDAYFGHLAFLESGLITTQSRCFTFRDNVPDSAYNEDGTLKHIGHKHDDGITYFYDANNEQPGYLANIQAGTYVGISAEIHHYKSLSRLSAKENIKPINEYHAVSEIRKMDECLYDYKSDPNHELAASGIIDDVHETPQYYMPPEFISKDGKSRKDSINLAYNTVVLQHVLKRLDRLEQENKELKRHVSVIFKMLKVVRKLLAKILKRG